MKGLGEGVAFSVLCIASVLLELNDLEASGLWIVIVIWALYSDWGQK